MAVSEYHMYGIRSMIHNSLTLDYKILYNDALQEFVFKHPKRVFENLNLCIVKYS